MNCFSEKVICSYFPIPHVQVGYFRNAEIIVQDREKIFLESKIETLKELNKNNPEDEMVKTLTELARSLGIQI